MGRQAGTVIRANGGDGGYDVDDDAFDDGVNLTMAMVTVIPVVGG